MKQLASKSVLRKVFAYSLLKRCDSSLECDLPQLQGLCCLLSKTIVKEQHKGDKADLLIDFLYHIFPTVLIYQYL